MKKIALIRRNGLGDLLCACPLILYLKKENPQNHITLFLDEGNAPLARYLKGIDECVVFPKGKKYLRVLSQAWRYRSRHYDLAISLKTSPMQLMNLFLFTLQAKERIAVVDHHWTSYLVNRAIPYNPRNRGIDHQALQTLHLIAPHFKSVPKELYPRIDLPRTYSGPPTLLISASTTRPSSRLDIDRYAELVNRWHREYPSFRTVIMALPQDQVRAQALGSKLSMAYHLCIPRAFDEFVQELNQCDGVFCGDGGIGHLAGALNKRALVLFGESSPNQWSPLGEDIVTLHDPIHVNRLSEREIYAAGKELFFAPSSPFFNDVGESSLG